MTVAAGLGGKRTLGFHRHLGQCGGVKQFVLATALSCAAITGGCQQRATGTYASNCSAPLKGWGGPNDGIGHLRPVLPVFLDASGSTHWGEIHISGPVGSNATVISDDTLRSHMASVSGLNPEPQLVLEVAPDAPCQRVRAIRTIIGNSRLCKKSELCSEGANWEAWPFSGGP